MFKHGKLCLYVEYGSGVCRLSHSKRRHLYTLSFGRVRSHMDFANQNANWTSYLSFNPMPFKKTKLILRASAFLRDHVSRLVYEHAWISGHDNIAHIWTKAISTQVFRSLMTRMRNGCHAPGDSTRDDIRFSMSFRPLCSLSSLSFDPLPIVHAHIPRYIVCWPTYVVCY